MIKVKNPGATGSLPTPLDQNEMKKKLLYAIMQGYHLKAKTQDDALKIYKSLPDYIKNSYLGNSTCMEIQGLGDYFILDCGSGLRRLGLDILKRQNPSKKINIFFSHYHWDHMLQSTPRQHRRLLLDVWVQ